MKSLRCLLGRHAPAFRPVSNGGYRFSRCRRCRLDIIQTPFDGWRVPNHGFRVTWRPAERAAGPATIRHRDLPSARGVFDFMQADDDGFDWMKDVAVSRPSTPAGLEDFMRVENRGGLWRRMPRP